MKRNLISEIAEIKSRAEFNSRHDINSRLNDIQYAFDENLNCNDTFDKELVKYIPIATVACFEAFFRSVYKELIDFGKPYNENAIKFNHSKNIKFDFEVVNAIESKTVTVGEFISHILPCNNFDDINANLSTLAGIDFADQVKKFKTDQPGNKKDLPNENDEQIIIDVKRTFELRHIFCHEFATNIRVDRNEIFRCFLNSKTFLNRTNDFIWDLLYPDAPKNQTEMNNHASELFDRVDNELNELILRIKEASNKHSCTPLNIELFDRSIIEWSKYRETKALFDASIVDGGSMYQTVYANSLTSTTKEKIESLQNEYAVDLRK